MIAKAAITPSTAKRGTKKYSKVNPKHAVSKLTTDTYTPFLCM